jgi:hypothetical protein
MVNLGYLYARGIGVEQNDAIAVAPAPHLQVQPGAGEGGRHALAEVGDAGKRPAVEADDDVAKAEAALGRRAARGSLEDERAGVVDEPEGKAKGQIEGLHLHAHPGFLRIAGEVAERHRQFKDPPELIGGSIA